MLAFAGLRISVHFKGMFVDGVSSPLIDQIHGRFHLLNMRLSAHVNDNKDEISNSGHDQENH